MSKIETAWAAGFFDGEGTVYVRHTKRHKGGSGKYYPLTSVELSVVQVRREPLQRFAKALGFGSVKGPYRNGNHRPYFRWLVAGRPSVHRALTRLWPFLSLPKKQQARECWRKLKSLKTLKSPKLPALPVG